MEVQMIRTAIATAALMTGLLLSSLCAAAEQSAAAQSAAQAGAPPAQVTTADAAPFIGGWTLALQGPNGPGTFDLTIKVDKEKVVAEITASGQPTNPIADVTKADKGLV